MKIPVNNDTAMPIYVAGQMIPPGETRHFDPDQVPPHLRPKAPEPEPEAPSDSLAELLDHSVKDIVAQIPALSDADLERLGDLEQAKGGEARKTLLGAIAEAQLDRADAKTGAGGAGNEGDGAA